jgi:capsular exopolysaccharide synthesis family protein
MFHTMLLVPPHVRLLISGGRASPLRLPWNNKNNSEEQFDPEGALISLYSPKSIASEAYRMLRTNVHFSSGGQSIRVLEVTSAVPGTGKSLTAANLAITFAQAGESVVLVDADMRRPTLHEKFELPQTPGLSEAIVTGEYDKSLKDGPVEGLMVVTAGTIPPNPSELLHSDRLEEFLEEMKSRADLVILDAPPVLAVTDALVLGARADGVIFVVSLLKSDKNAAKRSLEALRGVNAKVLGAVVRGIPNHKGRYGGGYYYNDYYYYYDSGYGADESSKETATK